MAVPADLAPVGFSASEVALLFSFLLLYLAVTIVDSTRGPVVNIAGALPVFGSGLSRAVDQAFGYVRGWLYSNLSASIVAYSNLLSWLDSLWAQFSETVVGLATLGTTAAFKITTQIIPAQVQLTLLRAEAVASAAEQRANTFANGLAAGLRAALAADAAATASLVSAVRSESVGLFQTAEADAAALFQAAETDAGRLAAAERAFTVASVATIEADLGRMFGQAQALTAAAEAALRGDLGAVERQLVADLQGGVSALEREIAAARTALAAGAVGAAAVAADVAAIRAMRCFQFCDQLGNLGSLLAALDVGAIFALYALARSNPGAAAGFLNETVTPAVQGFQRAAGGIVGS